MRRAPSIVLALVALTAVAGTSTARAQTPPLTIQALRNATYPVEGVPGGLATLDNGTFSTPAAPGSASTAVVSFVMGALGPVGGQPGAAVVLVSSGGGTGLFMDLYAVDATGETVARTNLGDRIKVEALAIDASGRIAVDLIVRAPDEPMASPPTLPEHRVYELSGGALTQIPAPPPTSTPVPAPTGTAGIATPRASAAFHAVLLGGALLAAAAARRAVRGAA